MTSHDQTQPAEAGPSPDEGAATGEATAADVPEATAVDAPADPPEPPAFAPRADPPRAPAPRRSGAFLGAVAGGAVALAAGFGASHLDLFGLRPLPDDSALQALAARTDALAADLAAATAETARMQDDLAGRIAAAAAEAAALPALQDEAAALTERLGQLETRLAALADLPADGSVSPAQIAALSAAVEALRAEVAQKSNPDTEAIRAIVREELQAWEAEAAERLQAEAETTRATAARAAALERLAQARVSGAPYADALSALQGEDLPEILARHADAGLPPLSTGFADAARRALDAARRTDPGAGLGDRLLSFLLMQSGARSLTPQEGPGADAVLSRAEAAVAAGNAQAALDEVATLPPGALAEMAEWSRLAEDHLAFDAAVKALSDTATP